MTVKSWLQILRRRMFSVSVVALLVLVAGVSAALLIPPSYRSTATILVEQEELSQEVTGTDRGAYADRRINILSKRVLSRDNLSRLAREFELFDETAYQGDKLLRSSLEDLRSRIDVETVTAEVIDSKMRFQVSATIAFNVSFVAAEPLRAQQVTERLVEMFFEENVALLSRGNAAASDLFGKEEHQLARQIDEAEEKLRVFKEKNVYALPEMQNVNIQSLEKTNDEISASRLQLKALHERRIFLESELVRLSPTSIVYDADGGRVLGYEDRLKMLRAEYAQKRSKYSLSHPDIKKLRREIAGLESELKALADKRADAEKEIEAELINLRTERTGLASRYAEDHPTIKSLDGRIEALTRQLQEEKGRALPSSMIDLKADNPAYIDAASKLKSTMLEIETLDERLLELEEERQVYEQRLEIAPLVEREFLQLERQYNQALEEHQTIRERRFAAQLAGAIESSSSGQGLRVLEEPDYPERPHKPNRKLLLVATLALALWAGIGTALIQEHYDQRIWTVDDVVRELSEQPLSVVPTMRVYVAKPASSNQPMKLGT